MAVTLKGQTAVYEGTSTDTKPTDADNNAIFKELDTGISYYYDGTDWNKIPSSGGGGGGTGTDNYNELNNKPSINGTVLSGNKSLDNLGIQAKLTFDSAPTEDSENPVESGGVYSALADKQDTISDLSTIRSGAAAGATAVQPAALETALAQKQDALSSEQLDAVNSGVTSADVEQITTNKNNILSILGNSYKNKLHYKSGYVAGFTQTIGEVTFTINDDLSITANSNGNAVTANRTFSIYNGLPFHVAGDIISGGVSSQCSVECELATNPYTNYGYSTTGVGIMTAATGTVEVFCRVKAGAAVNVTFRPMICDSGLYDASDTFTPFRAPNLRLVRDKKIMLKDSDITWKQSTAGLYYTDPIAISGIDYVVSAIITTFAYLSDSNIIQVIGSDTAPNSIRFMANSDNIASTAYVRVTVLGF